jgi:hypothetical protein
VRARSQDNKVHNFSIGEKDALTETDVLSDNTGKITAMAYSNDNSLFVAADSNRNIFLFKEKKVCLCFSLSLSLVVSLCRVSSPTPHPILLLFSHNPSFKT